MRNNPQYLKQHSLTYGKGKEKGYDYIIRGGDSTELRKVAMPEIAITTEYGSENEIMKKNRRIYDDEQQFYYDKRNY